jgi:hypothetical protein
MFMLFRWFRVWVQFFSVAMVTSETSYNSSESWSFTASIFVYDGERRAAISLCSLSDRIWMRQPCIRSNLSLLLLWRRMGGNHLLSYRRINICCHGNGVVVPRSVCALIYRLFSRLRLSKSGNLCVFVVFSCTLDVSCVFLLIGGKNHANTVA